MLHRHGILSEPKKEQTLMQPITTLPKPERVLLPLWYPHETPRIPACEVGDTIVRGTPLGISEKADAPILPCTVTGAFLGTREIEHPLFGTLCCADVAVTDIGLVPEERDQEADTLDLWDTVRRAGIIDERDGQYLCDKMAAWAQEPVGTLVADATEAQPYGTAQLSLLRERAKDCAQGLALLADALQAKRRHIAVQLPRHIRRSLCAPLPRSAIYTVANRYPVQHFARPFSPKPVRVVGLAACLAVYDAVQRTESACCGVVTVSGNAVQKPQNLRVPYGTMLSDILRACKVKQDALIILGDAFTGVPCSDDVPVLPRMTCILALDGYQAPAAKTCIGCGRCVSACYKGLLPYEIARRYQNGHFSRLAPLQPERCDGCAACEVICPAARPLTSLIQQAAGHCSMVSKWRPEDD